MKSDESIELLGMKLLNNKMLGTKEGIDALRLTEVLEYIVTCSDNELSSKTNKNNHNDYIANKSFAWFQPYKLQHAILIAESGDVEQAWKYLIILKKTIEYHKEEEKKIMNKNAESSPCLHSPTFLHKLTLFEDRLSKCIGKDSGNIKNSIYGNNNGGSGKGGGFFSKVGGAILGSLEKMTQAEEDEANESAVNNASTTNGVQRNVVGRPAAVNTQKQPMMQTYHPHSSTSNEQPMLQQHDGQQQGTSRAMFHSTSMPLTTAYPSDDPNYHTLQHDSQHSFKEQPPPSSSTSMNTTTTAPPPSFVSYSKDIKEPSNPPPAVVQEPSSPVTPRGMVRSMSTPSTMSSSSNGGENSQSSGKDNKAKPTIKVDVAAPKGWIASKFSKWMYPDAAEATLGGEMDAYFDKVKGRWVFPGEDASAVDDTLNSAPPPPPNMKQTASSPNLTGSSGGDASNDPLAALMLPPQRAMPSSSNNDPLAALMAPPQPRRAANSSNRAISTPASVNGGKSGGAPPMFFNPAAAKK
jgi:hypothetical protein